jgi:hypothetical protein
MMGGNAARNVQSRNINEFGIQCVCWFYSHVISAVFSTYDDVDTLVKASSPGLVRRLGRSYAALCEVWL